MSRFGRDSEWIKRLEADAYEAVAEALSAGEEIDPSLIPLCRAPGPGGVECSEFRDHRGDHKSTMLGELAKEDARRGAIEFAPRSKRRGRSPVEGSTMTWAQICQASVIDEATMYTCGLPLGHACDHACGAYVWT